VADDGPVGEHARSGGTPTGVVGGSQAGGAPTASARVAAILARLRAVTRYPDEARARDLSGVATVRFSLSAQGTVERVDLVRSSGHASLDRAALDAVRRGAPYPGGPVTLETPLVFDLRPAGRR
jgi:protein TonB